MLRSIHSRPLPWADKTMSVMRADLLEACEKDLAGFPSHCLFDAESKDQDAESFYELSFFPEEDRLRADAGFLPKLHTVQELRNRVLHQFAQETALLSVEEHDLLVRVTLMGGRAPLRDWNELLPARGLARRLWARVETGGSVRNLVMPRQLCSAALLLMAGDSHRQVREIAEQVHDTIENSLYLLGTVQAAGPERHFAALLKGTFAENRPDLIRRFLLVGYDCVYDRSGRLLLIHPGLAEPDRLQAHAGADMDPESLSSASDSVEAVEDPLYTRMLGLLMDATRPEITPEDAVEDLIILAKQGVPPEEMLSVLDSMLMCKSTPEMAEALRAMYQEIPRWVNLGSSRVQ